MKTYNKKTNFERPFKILQWENILGLSEAIKKVNLSQSHYYKLELELFYPEIEAEIAVLAKFIYVLGLIVYVQRVYK